MSEDAHEISPINEKSKPNKPNKHNAAHLIARFFILNFCENLAEIGCPKSAEPDMWFRYLSLEDQMEVIRKLDDIIIRDYKATR